MGGISLKSGEPWMVSGWIYQRVLDEVERLHPEDQELVTAIRYAEANELLSPEFVEPKTWGRLQDALLVASNRLLNGSDRDERLIRAVTDLKARLEKR